MTALIKTERIMFNFSCVTSDSQRLLSKMDLKLLRSYGTTCIFYKKSYNKARFRISSNEWKISLWMIEINFLQFKEYLSYSEATLIVLYSTFKLLINP